MLRSLHWLPVAQRIEFKTALLVYKSFHGRAPKYLADMLKPYEPPRALRSSGRGLLVVPRVTTKHGEAAFQFHAAKVWNSLSEDVRQASTLSMFKSRLKTCLFTAAYGS